MSQRLFDVISEVGARVVQAPQLLLGLDFDGTLTPIVDDPALTRLAPEVRTAVERLARQERVAVAVISGRQRSEVQALIGVPDLIYAGNHGLEISAPGCLFVEPAAAASCSALKELAATLAQKLQHLPGVWVEDKGLTLSVHYRRAARQHHDEIKRLVHGVLAGANYPFVLTMGDMVHEVRPRVYWNKGAALGWIKEHLGIQNALTIYVGDDTTDEDAFAALADEITIKVNGGDDTAARYHLEGPAEVHRFLQWLEAELAARPLILTSPPRE